MVDRTDSLQQKSVQNSMMKEQRSETPLFFHQPEPIPKTRNIPPKVLTQGRIKIRLTLLPVLETRIGDLTMYITSRGLLYPSYQKPSQWQIFEHTMPACKYSLFETIHALLERCSTQDGYNAFIALTGNAKESRHGHVEVVSRWITSTTLVVGRAEVGGDYGDGGAAEPPLWISPVVAD
ncbi:hypothetical protein M9H77_21914 [Catharanthus roseus]|uniref:Uncharacterized protein n=1 Tax=Catharanthus roseus TaxID=4058 RepID=A0ACC0APE2_CATRO|nr:hypothetical protein M9H77_21914 [Catharanthus roseus]